MAFRTSARLPPDFEVVVAEQTDAAALVELAERHPDLRVVIDDASHLKALTIGSFDILFPRLPSGSIYVIEDVLSSYSAVWRGDQQYNREAPENTRADFDELLARLTRDCDLGGPNRTVAFVHAWPGLVVFGRA